MPTPIRRIIILFGSFLTVYIFSLGLIFLVELANRGNWHALLVSWSILITIALTLIYAAVRGFVAGFNWLSGQQRASANEQKTKRAFHNDDEDNRLALLLSLMTPDERAMFKDRLADELSADGDMLSMAELLARQERTSQRS